MGLPVDNCTMGQAIDCLLAVMNGGRSIRASFVNADCVNISCRNVEYRDAVAGADLVFADGSGMRMAGRKLGQPIADNVNGTDMFPLLCKAMAAAGKSVYLLGAREGIGDAVAQWIASNVPGLKVAGVQHGYFPPEQESRVISAIRSSGADLLLVAFGAPRQDVWIARHLSELGVKVAMGVGGLFDFYSGRIPRAPLWMRRLGIEWIYRFIQEPKRMWKRYLVGNFVFTYRVYRERARQSKQPPAGGQGASGGRES